MEFKQLQYFKTIAETGNLSKASEIVFVSQSALTKSLQALEKELSVRLFDRVGKRIVLNDAGKQLYVHACSIIEQMKELEHDMRLYTDLPREINIVTDNSIISEYVIPELKLNNPSMCLDAELCLEADIYRNLLLNNKKMMIISKNPIIDKSISNVLVFEDEILLRVPQSSHLAQFDKVPLSVFEGESFAVADKNNYFVKVLMKLFEDNHIHISFINLYNPLFYANSVENLNMNSFTTRIISYFCKWSRSRIVKIDTENECLKPKLYASFTKQNKMIVQPVIDEFLLYNKKIHEEE